MSESTRKFKHYADVVKGAVKVGEEQRAIEIILKKGGRSDMLGFEILNLDRSMAGAVTTRFEALIAKGDQRLTIRYPASED